jgi:hypothetical protein
MNTRIQYVAEPNGTVVAVQVELNAWIALLEKLANYEERSRPTSKLDRQLAVLVRKRVGNRKKVDLDDIGFIGTGRPMSEIESLLISAHIQAHKVKQSASLPNLSKRKTRLARVKR